MKNIVENIETTFLKNFVWYEDTTYDEGYNNVYLINPKDGKCILKLSRSGRLSWCGVFYEKHFSRYFGIPLSDFRSIIRQYVYKNIEEGRIIDHMKKSKVIEYPEGLFF